MILICRFRRPLANAQTNRFALRLARDSAQREQIVQLAGVYAYWTLVVLRLGQCIEGQRAAAQSRSQYLLNRSKNVSV
jgi:glutamate-1-semialdehyde aminotransferase